MSFLFPAFLLALVLVLIPIIIHFFNFKRYKTLYFSNVTLIKLLNKKNRKKSQLKQILILLSRILAIVALVFAFSRPYFSGNNKIKESAQNVVLVYIDNSLSMKAEGENGQLLEQAKTKSLEIANSYPIGTQFLICTNDFLPNNRVLLNKEEFANEISKISESANPTDLNRILLYSKGIFDDINIKTGKSLYIFSDFQKNSGEFKNLKPDSTYFAYLVHFKPIPTSNLIVDSCWFEVPGRKLFQNEELFVRVKNKSEKSFQNVPLRLYVNDSLKAVSNINLAENSDSVFTLNYTNYSQNIQLCRVELDDYPVIYDNTYYFSYSVQNKLNALGISNNNSDGTEFLRTFFIDDAFINYEEKTANNLQVSKFKNYECIFLINNNQISSGLKTELTNWLKLGGTLVIFPEKLANYSEYNSLLNDINCKTITSFDTAKVDISEINYTHKIYSESFRKHEKNSDLPQINGFVSFDDTQLRTETTLLKLRNGKNALFTSNFGDGTAYIFSFPLNRLNFDFIKHPVFIPTIYNIVLYSGFSQIISYPLSVNQSIKLNNLNITADQLIIKNEQTNEEFYATVKNLGNGQKQLITDGINKNAGHFLVVDDSKIIQSVSFNNSRSESINNFYSVDELNKIIGAGIFRNFKIIDNEKSEVSEIIGHDNNAKQLWKFFLIIALFFLLTEMAIVRFWK